MQQRIITRTFSLLIFSLLSLSSGAQAQCDQRRVVLSDDQAFQDNFGRTVEIEGDTMVVGVPLRDDLGSISGAAYIFERRGGAWVQTAKLTGSDTDAGDWFGYSHDLDGNQLVVGARGADGLVAGTGAVYMFERAAPGSPFVQVDKVFADDGVSGDDFGVAVGLGGSMLIVGASGFGYSGAPKAGATYAFQRTGANWTSRVQEARFRPTTPRTFMQFGATVATNGTYAVIGAYSEGNGNGVIYIYQRGGNWSLRQKLAGNGSGAFFGFSLSLSGDQLFVGAPNDVTANGREGGVYRHQLSNGTWSLQEILRASDSMAGWYFGSAVDVDGNNALIGASNADNRVGAAYALSLANGTWSETNKYTPWNGVPSDLFGVGVALSGDHAVVGASNHDVVSGDEGALYVFSAEPGPFVYGCGSNPSGSFTVGGEPKIGTTLDFSIDNPLGTQMPGSQSLLGISLQPLAYPCGIDRGRRGMKNGKAGELLIDLSASARVALVMGPAWSGPGSPAIVSVSIPNDASLVGTDVFAQGMLMDNSPIAGPKLGLTDAACFTITN